ncbi:MAG TPA: hypothetical protein DCE71_00900, partial [Parachlamydiales bacterium]|nr:hypothetical protein [Parachlamydiales bacterium]
GLECCYINSWPKSFNLNNLKKLVLNGNFLGSIFEILNNHPNLESLALDENELENLPENLKFPKLQFLSLNRNWITRLPTSWNMPELKELSLTENELTSLPEYFSYPKLTRLALTDNQNLRELPMSLAYCDRHLTIAVNETGISRETVKIILTKREELKFVERVATLLGEWNGRLDDDSDLRLPIEMIGEIAELGTLHGELNEYWIRSTSLAEEIELEILDERASSSSEFSGSRKRKRES